MCNCGVYVNKYTKTFLKQVVVDVKHFNVFSFYKHVFKCFWFYFIFFNVTFLAL